MNPDTEPSTWDDPSDTIAQEFDTEFDEPDISNIPNVSDAPNIPNNQETELPPISYTPQHNSENNEGCAKAAAAFGLAFAIFFIIAFVITLFSSILSDLSDDFIWGDDTNWDDYIQTWGIVNEGGFLDEESSWVMMVGEEWECDGVEICLSSCEKYLEQMRRIHKAMIRYGVYTQSLRIIRSKILHCQKLTVMRMGILWEML